MAAHYVQEIRSFQPEGPYYLGGYSMGGLIAFEMAQQLHRLGQRAALLALFDTMPICVIPWTVYGRAMASYLRGRCAFHLRRWWEMPNRDRLDYFRGRWAALQFWIARNRAKPPVVTAPPLKGSQALDVPGFADYYHALASAYRLQRYPGSADIFVSDDGKPQWVSSWRHLVRGGVSFHRVPGTHNQLLTPGFLPALGKVLRTALERAQQKANLHASSAS
jgi:thioesterase domain-containing protein